jgi:hypothetical protein
MTTTPHVHRQSAVKCTSNFCFRWQRIYIATARQVKRLESISRSPIYSHFGETISGVVTIRAYNMTDNFIEENERKIDVNQASKHPGADFSYIFTLKIKGKIGISAGKVLKNNFC